MRLLILSSLALVSLCLSARLDTEWWKRTEIYDILIWSFKDTDGDGIGDLKGVTSKLDYLKELGISTIKLSPIFSSIQNIHQNYSINDFEKIHTTLGNMNDFDSLMKEAKTRGIKVILDFVINHCSPFHEWFKKSQRRIDPYTDYFIWKDEIPAGSYYWGWNPHWKHDEVRKQFYYHNYELPSVDLNLRNEAVKEEVKKIIKFWFDKGVSGLNLLSANVYMEYFPEGDTQYNDEIQTIREDHPDSYEFVHEIREYVDSYNKEHGGYERILIVAQSNIEKYPNLRGNSTYPMAHTVSQSILENHDINVNYYESFFLNWFVNHDKEENEKNGPLLLISEDAGTFRLGNRFYNKQLIDVWLTAVFMLPNIVHIYYGQEIHLADCWSYQYDLFYQRPFPASMQWDNSLLAGFTSSEFTLMPPNTDYWNNNVEKSINNELSSYNTMKDLLKLRKTETIKHGNLESHIISRWIFAFTRSYEGKETYITILNLENQSSRVELQKLFGDLPETVKVVASSPNAVYRKENMIETGSSLLLNPTSSMVLLIETTDL